MESAERVFVLLFLFYDKKYALWAQVWKKARKKGGNIKKTGFILFFLCGTDNQTDSSGSCA